MATNAESAGWRSRWTVADPPPIGGALLGAEEGRWETWPGTGLEGRDLGLAAASGGVLSAQHIRATGADAGPADWHCYDLDFELLYVLAGTLTLQGQDGQVHELAAGSAFFHPGFYFHRDVFRSGDFEVVYLTSPASGERFEGRDAELPSRAAALPATRAGVYTHGQIEEYSGIETPFLRRDLGIGGPTGGRLGAHVLRSAEPGADTGRQRGGAARWLMVVEGESSIEVGEDPVRRLARGDSIAIGAGARTRLSLAPGTGGFAALEISLPA